MPFKGLSRNIASDTERYIYRTVQEGCNEGNDSEEEDSFSPKVEQWKAEQVEQELLFSCAICSDNFKGKLHFHTHMMYHLGGHNQMSSEDVLQTLTCRECGRLFSGSHHYSPRRAGRTLRSQKH